MGAPNEGINEGPDTSRCRTKPPLLAWVFVPSLSQVFERDSTSVKSNFADGLATDTETVEMRYSCDMDYLEVLREKIGRLRAEIAEIQVLNKRYRLQDSNDRDAEIAHGQRHERLQAIQQELSQLSSLGRKVQSAEEMKEKHRFDTESLSLAQDVAKSVSSRLNKEMKSTSSSHT